MISIDVLSWPGQLRHICPTWVKLENPPKISQCTPEKFHNIRNKIHQTCLCFFQNSSNIMTVINNNTSSKSKSSGPQSDWHLICFLSFSCSSVNAENHVIHLRGEAEHLEPSPPFFPQVMLMSIPSGNQRRNFTPETNRPSTYKGMLKMLAGKSHVPNMKRGNHLPALFGWKTLQKAAFQDPFKILSSYLYPFLCVEQAFSTFTCWCFYVGSQHPTRWIPQLDQPIRK